MLMEGRGQGIAWIEGRGGDRALPGLRGGEGTGHGLDQTNQIETTSVDLCNMHAYTSVLKWFHMQTPHQ